MQYTHLESKKVTSVLDLGQVKDLRDFNEVKKPFRILSLNGGGARALFQAHYLNQVSKSSLGTFWQDFDLIIGTSAGAIVAAALCRGMHPSEIIDLLEEKKNNPFPNPLWVGIKTKILKATRGAGFDNAKLKVFLGKVFGKETRLKDCKGPQLAITATHLSDSSVRVFSSLTKESDNDLKVVDALMASTALPGAFQPYSIREGEQGEEHQYIDGCMWANAPLLAAVSLAVEKKQCSLNDIRVVSIGTACKAYSPSLKDHMKLKVDSRSFYEHLLQISFSAAEVAAYESVIKLVGKKNILHIDDFLESEIRAWEWSKAIDKLPNVAKKIVNQKIVTGKLTELAYN